MEPFQLARWPPTMPFQLAISPPTMSGWAGVSLRQCAPESKLAKLENCENVAPAPAWVHRSVMRAVAGLEASTAMSHSSWKVFVDGGWAPTAMSPPRVQVAARSWEV